MVKVKVTALVIVIAIVIVIETATLKVTQRVCTASTLARDSIHIRLNCVTLMPAFGLS